MFCVHPFSTYANFSKKSLLHGNKYSKMSRLLQMFHQSACSPQYFRTENSNLRDSNIWEININTIIIFVIYCHCVKSIQIRSFFFCSVFRQFVFGLNTEKYGPEKTPYLDTFHAVQFHQIWQWISIIFKGALKWYFMA